MRPLIVIPAYNEAQNIGVLLERLARDCPGASVLIVDDSPGEESAEIIRRDPDFERQGFPVAPPGKTRFRLGVHRRFPMGAGEGFRLLRGDGRRTFPMTPPTSRACSRP